MKFITGAQTGVAVAVVRIGGLGTVDFFGDMGDPPAGVVSKLGAGKEIAGDNRKM